MKGLFTKVQAQLINQKGMVKHPGTHNRRKHLSVLNLKGQLLETSERYSQGRERAAAPLGAMLLEEELSQCHQRSAGASHGPTLMEGQRARKTVTKRKRI